jgi:hypothetical protein
MSSVPVIPLSPPLKSDRGRRVGLVAPEGSSPSVLTLDTIGKLIEHRCEVTLWCRRCKSVGDVDLQGVAAERGQDWMFVGQRWPLACEHCASDDVAIHIAPPRGRGGR